jgi:DNA-binding transcriptional LysR family regulator
VRLLEEDLGAALFVRRNRRVFLTEEGRVLALAVRDGMDLMRQAARTLRRQPRRMHLVLSCEPTLLMRWLIPRWSGFRERFPEVDVLLVAGGGAVNFGSGIDLAIRRDDFAWPSGTHAEFLCAERVGPVCKPALARRWFEQVGNALSPRTTAPRLHTRTRMNAWYDWSLRSGTDLPNAAEQVFEHFYFSLQAAVAGLGLAIGSWLMVRDDLDNGVLVAPAGFVPDGSGYWLLAPQAPLGDGAHALLLEWLRENV